MDDDDEDVYEEPEPMSVEEHLQLVKSNAPGELLEIPSAIPLGPEGGLELGKALNGNNQIKCIVLEDLGLDDAAVCSIVDSLMNNETVTSLDLNENRLLTSASAVALGRLINHNVTLMELTLNGMQQGKLFFDELALGLASAEHLRTLSLQHNGITAAEVVELSSSIASNTSLFALDISHNPLGDTGIAHVAAGLRQSHSLRTVNLNVRPSLHLR